MKRFIQKSALTGMFFLFAISSCMKSETVNPTHGVDFDREIASIIIEEKTYENVIIELKATALGERHESVNVTVKDAKTKEIIYNKCFENSYLYGFSNGTIQVGNGKFIQVILYKDKESGDLLGKIREIGID